MRGMADPKVQCEPTETLREEEGRVGHPEGCEKRSSKGHEQNLKSQRNTVQAGK